MSPTPEIQLFMFESSPVSPAGDAISFRIYNLLLGMMGVPHFTTQSLRSGTRVTCTALVHSMFLHRNPKSCIRLGESIDALNERQ
jgi:hypothetical protein